MPAQAENFGDYIIIPGRVFSIVLYFILIIPVLLSDGVNFPAAIALEGCIASTPGSRTKPIGDPMGADIPVKAVPTISKYQENSLQSDDPCIC